MTSKPSNLDSAIGNSERFEILAKLGEGSMGVVYAAHDKLRHMRVAVKTMRSVNARSLYRFKREFRALSELSHPNILQLHELIAGEDGRWLLAMELVEGEDLLAHVGASDHASEPSMISHRSSTRPPSTDGTLVDESVTPTARLDGNFVTLPARARDARPRVSDLVGLDRLRDAMCQLAAALEALHRSGIVHRDLKPSNVMVTGEGRVVLMDFGVVAELQLDYADPAEGRALMGTPTFMAPEQGIGHPPSAAADWYAFGVILYRALTGTMPYHGPARALLQAKQDQPPTPIDELVRELPSELGELCMRLLSRRPRHRPSSTEIFACLRGAEPAVSTTPAPTTDAVFVGRARELAALLDTYAEVAAGRVRLVELCGPAGIGKSSVARRFLDQLSQVDDPPLVLRSRCRERESLPYRAFDEAIDALCVHIDALDPGARARLKLDDLAYLARLFPVLERLPESRRVNIDARTKPAEVRARALAALRQIVRNVSARRPVVLYIEDLQWADDDSTPMLAALFEPPLDRPVMVLVNERVQPLDPNSSLAESEVLRAPALGELLAELEARGCSRRVDVGPLSDDEQRELIKRLAPELRVSEDTIAQLERQAGGHPLLLDELTRALRASARLHDGAPNLTELIQSRVRRLPLAAQILLEVLVVAGEPLPSRVLAEAAELDQDQRERAIHLLDLARLVRLSASVADPWLDVYQDQIGEALRDGLEDELVIRHAAALARALERWGEASPTLLARLWQSAGVLDKAAGYYLEAGRLAAGQLAFGRAQTVYGEASRLGRELGGDAGLKLRREAWSGLAQLARVTGANAELIAEGEALVAKLGDSEQLRERARVHYLMGCILMTRGDLEGCARHHQAALRAAERGGCFELRARALGGLGDVEFMHGHMRSCETYCREAIALSRAHGLAEVEAAQLALGASNRFFDGDIASARRYVDRGLRLGDPRCKAIASAIQVWCDLHGGQLERAREWSERSTEQVEAFSLDYLRNLVALNATEIEICEGHWQRAELIATRAVDRARREGWVFPLVSLLGAKAWASKEPAARLAALDDGLAELDATGHAHERMHFFRLALEAMLDSADWDRVEALADRLDALTRAEPPGWMTLVSARARVLAQIGRGAHDSATLTTLESLRARAEGAGFVLMARSLQRAELA